MSLNHILQLVVCLLLLVGLTPLLGSYMARLFSDSLSIPFLSVVERFCYRIARINPEEQMGWWQYAKAWLFFNLWGLLFVFGVLLLQALLPLNPEKLPAVSWPLAFNIAVSFVTNTNWQSYAGETTLSYASQMVALTSQNFLSASSGMCALLVLIRGLTKRQEKSVGNFFVDLVRTSVYILLPLASIVAILLCSQGVIQTFSPSVTVETLEHQFQTIPLGPVASQVAIKQLGTNGGGFFNANSAHPFENPSLLTNGLEILCIFLIPAALTYAYGIMIGSRRHGWLLFSVMFILWGIGFALALTSETVAPSIAGATPLMEGKETRLGVSSSILWTTLTTATANGSVNSVLTSLSPLAGGVAMFNIMLGELLFGGVGVGMCTMIMFVLLTVFLCGLMVGRTPEYLGKKIEKREIQLVTISILSPTALILLGSSLSLLIPQAVKCIGSGGPHGLSEMLYAFSSASGNNGSGFSSLNANTSYYNITLGITMVLGRLAVILPSLAVAGLLAKKKISPPSVGTFSTNTGLFVILLIGVILIVGALSFFPALSLGPIVEHFLTIEGRTF